MTSTEKRLARTEGGGPPAVGPNAGPPETRPGLSSTAIRRLAMGAFVWLPAFGLVAALYGGKLTVGAVFIAFAWVTFALAAWYLGRAALAFDVAPADVIALEGTIDDERRAELLQEKKVLLKAIKEIEFDHQMGKLDDADAAEITATYRGRALVIMRLLDEHRSVDYGAVVEKELARRIAKAGGLAKKALPAATAVADERADSAADAAEDDDDDSDDSDDAPAPVAKVAAGTCGACGTRNDADAVFCKKCAARLGS